MRASKLTERPIQRAIIEHLDRLACHAIHVPNGAHLAGDALARAIQAAKLKADGLSPGFPDLTVIDRRIPRIGFMEVKREGRIDLDPEQMWWRDELLRLGFPWALVNTPDGGGDVLRAWGWR